MSGRDDNYYQHAVNTYTRVTGLSLNDGQKRCAVNLLHMRDKIRADNNRPFMEYDEIADVMFAFFTGLYYQREVEKPKQVQPMRGRSRA